MDNWCEQRLWAAIELVLDVLSEANANEASPEAIYWLGKAGRAIEMADEQLAISSRLEG
jgi:hypothetical protein